MQQQRMAYISNQSKQQYPHPQQQQTLVSKELGAQQHAQQSLGQQQNQSNKGQFIESQQIVHQQQQQQRAYQQGLQLYFYFFL
jgi:hypothetical protein